MIKYARDVDFRGDDLVAKERQIRVDLSLQVEQAVHQFSGLSSLDPKQPTYQTISGRGLVDLKQLQRFLVRVLHHDVRLIGVAAAFDQDSMQQREVSSTLTPSQMQTLPMEQSTVALA